jgi:hypothetical protein
MSIALQIQHVDGLRLRQQLAIKVERIAGTETSDGLVKGATEWRFEKEPGTHKDMDVPQDRDKRNPEKVLGTYSPCISYALKNLVIEMKGKLINVDFRNTSVRNTLRIKVQTLVGTGRKNKAEEEIKEWKDQGVTYLPATQWGGFSVGDGQRVVLDEMPT